MPIPLPNLDDRTYADLVAEAQAMIPALYPEWTNHNPSDPGIVLVEMLAWLTEMALYQVNEITDQHVVAFLELLNGPVWELAAGENVETAVQKTVLALHERYRAVTGADFEHLVLHNWPLSPAAQKLGAAGRVQRVCCLPQCNLEADDPTAPAPAHVSLVIVPPAAAAAPIPSDELLRALWHFLDERRLLTTLHHVVRPVYVPVTVQASIYLREDAPLASSLAQAQNQLRRYFHPLQGGPDGTGWPFGRGVYASEIYAILSKISQVNYVEDVALIGREQQPDPVGYNLARHELVQIDLSQLQVIDIYGNESKGS